MKKRIFLVMLVGAVLATGAAAAYLHQAVQRIEGALLELEDGVRIHYTDEGEGVPVVLVHGFAANADVNWRQPGVTEVLAESFRVISIDNRGHGLSSKPRDPDAYGLEMVDDIIRLLDHLEIDKAHVVGYSMGGFITLKLASQYPDRLLSAAPCGMAWQITPDENRDFMYSFADSLENGGSLGPLMERLMPEGQELSRFRLASIDFFMGRTNDLVALAHLVRSFTDFEVPEATIRANTVPVLTVVGSIDPLREGFEYMHEIMPRHELVVVEGGDHISAIRRSEFIEALQDFLGRHSPSELHEEKAPERQAA